MRTLNYLETLIYYDGPKLITAKDQSGVDYICLLYDEKDTTDNFLCVSISKRRLSSLLSGQIDLRSIFETPETNELFDGIATDGDFSSIATSGIDADSKIKSLFPEQGVYLKE